MDWSADHRWRDMLLPVAKDQNIHDAAKEGKIVRVKELLKADICVNARDENQWTPLHYAASRGHNCLALTLLDCGADVNARDNCQKTPLHYAAINQQWSMVSFLLRKDALVDPHDGYYQATKDYLHCVGPFGQIDEDNETKCNRMCATMKLVECFNNQQDERFFAFACAKDARLGSDSPAHSLAPNLFSYIYELADRHTMDRNHLAYGQSN